uniref:Uncharacterized protein n=1 Tax=Cannabis sativa TaxID=3483 RepID=A0A803QDH6_CANSA
FELSQSYQDPNLGQNRVRIESRFRVESVSPIKLWVRSQGVGSGPVGVRVKSGSKSEQTLRFQAT